MEHARIGSVASKGEGVLASHKISLKDTIYSINHPALLAISSENLAEFCYHCHAGSKPESSWYSIGQYRDAHLQQCSACRIARFCGKKCQTAAWKRYHKFECKRMAKLTPRVLHESVRAVQRFCLQRDNDTISDELWQKVLGLTSHMDDIRQAGGDDWTNLILYAKAAHEDSETKVDLQIVLKLMCILKSNGLILQTTYGDSIGVFLDPVLVKINHSCDGNVFVHRPIYTNTTGWLQKRSSDERMVKLLPLREIAEGEEMTMPYIDFHEDVEKRRANLQKNHFFVCMCNKCVQDVTTKRELQKSNSKLARRLDDWQNDTDELLGSLKKPPFSAETIAKGIAKLEEIVNGMDNEASISPALDPYSRAIHELKLLYMDRRRACDKALVCALKEHFIIGPQVYNSAIYPTSIVHAIYLLQVFALLDETFTSSHGHPPEIEQARRGIEARGFSRRSFVYWRLRICVDTRKSLLDSAMTDVAECFEIEQMTIGVNDRDQFQELLGTERIRKESEEEMRKLLGLTEDKWNEAVRECGK